MCRCRALFSNSMNGAVNEWRIDSSHLLPTSTALPEKTLFLHRARPTRGSYAGVRQCQVITADLSHFTCWAWDLLIWQLLSVPSLQMQHAHGQYCTTVTPLHWDHISLVQLLHLVYEFPIKCVEGLPDGRMEAGSLIRTLHPSFTPESPDE